MQKYLFRMLCMALLVMVLLVACGLETKTETELILNPATLPNPPDFSQPLVAINTTNAGAIQLLGVIQLDSVTNLAPNPVVRDQVAISHTDGRIRLFDLPQVQEAVELGDLSDNVHTISFNTEATTLITADDDGNIRLWSIADGSEMLAVNIDDETLQVVAISPLGDLFAASGEERTVHIWSLPDGYEIANLSERNSTIRSLAFNPLGTLLAAGARDGSIQVFRVRSQALYGQFTHDAAVTALTFYTDGETLISGDAAGIVRAWDTANKTSAKIGGAEIVLVGAPSPVRSLAFSADNRVLAVGHEDGTIILWDFSTGNQLGRETIIRNTEADVVLVGVMFVQDDQVLAAITQSGQVWMWGPEPGALPTETPTATITATASVTSTPTATLEPSETSPPTETPENTDTPEASNTPEIETTPSQEPTQSVKSGPTVTLNATLVPTATRTLSPTPTSRVSPTPTTPPPPPCNVTAQFDNARVRALPSVNAEQVGRILQGESAAVDSQTLGASNEVWWHVIDLDGWVRSDTVVADEGCEDVPLVEVDD